MFRPGANYRLGDGTEAVVEVQDAGILNLATGRVIACDPFWGADVQRRVPPFITTVPPGHYPVTLSLARGLLDRPDPVPRLGAAAKLTIRDEPVVAWEVALHPGDDPERLEPDQIYTLGVDSGHASFLDASAVGPLVALDEPGSELDRLFEQVWGNEWVNLVVDEVSGLNVVVFHCGLGDGGYATWIGRSADGEPACFAVDLLVFSESFVTDHLNTRALCHPQVGPDERRLAISCSERQRARNPTGGLGADLVTDLDLLEARTERRREPAHGVGR